MRTRSGVIAVLALPALFTISCAQGGDGQVAPRALALPTEPTAVSQGAGPPRVGSGTGLITSLEEVSSRNAGPNVIKERRLTGSIDGTLQGTFVEEVRGVIHDGRVTFEGTLEFTGSIPECGVGTFVLGLSGRGQAGALPVTDASVRVIHHAANTLPVAGSGTVHQNGPLLSYEIQYTCN